jgi:hypothetical protein
MEMSTERHMFSYSCGEESVCVNTSAISVPDLCQKFEDYLRACGFGFTGHIAICNDRDCPHHEPPADLNPTEDGKEAL